jgi:multisubunit Na+/H+ antiporter MnhB subunit
MDTNFHAFVFIATIVFYIILRSYKKKEPEDKKTSNLIYVLLVPIILYTGNYFYQKNKQNTLSQEQLPSIEHSISDDLLTAPYPVSSDSLSI